MVKKFNTKVEVAESVGSVFAKDRTLDYCAELEHKKSYDALTTTEKAEVDTLARDRFMTYGLLKTSSNSNDKVKLDLSDDFIKGSNKYPVTPHQTLLLLDKYSKKPTAVTQSEGTNCICSEGQGERQRKQEG
jgi:hypothetical protein